MIDTTALIAAVRELADDTVVKDCQYFRYGHSYKYDLNYTAPVCIIGHALVKIGAATEVRDYDNLTRIDTLLAQRNHLVVQNQQERLWLREVQKGQDKKMSWSDAVANADDQVPLP